MRIFLSHSHKDNNWCEEFVAELTRQGADVWYDKAGLYVGAQWIKKIQEELTSRDVFLIVLTPDAYASEWVQEEISLALTLRKRLIGIIHKPTQVTGFLKNYQMLDATGKSPFAVAVEISAALGVKKPPDKDEYCSVEIRREGFNSFVEVIGPYDNEFNVFLPQDKDKQNSSNSRIVSISRVIWPTDKSRGDDRTRVELDAAHEMGKELERGGWQMGMQDPDYPFDAGSALQDGIWPWADFERKGSRSNKT